jgi:sortase A
VLMLLGVILVIFWIWQALISDGVIGSEQQTEARKVSSNWNLRAAEGPTNTQASSEDPPVAKIPGASNVYGILYVPRFGADYSRLIGEGTHPEVLDSTRFGVGRYSNSANLGELGNTAIAGHRNAFGGAFSKLPDLEVGDKIYIETNAGWYAYSFRNFEYVWPSDKDVLNPLPRTDSSSSTSRVLTLTTCHPLFSIDERLIAYALFDGWFPRESGPPEDLAAIIGQNP